MARTDSLGINVSILFFYHSVQWAFPNTAVRLAFKRAFSTTRIGLIQPRWFILIRIG